MGAPVHEAMIIPLKDGEGELVILLQQWEKPIKKETASIGLDPQPTLIHNPFCHGHIRIIPISAKKKVLHCETCSMRIDLPASIKTVGDLKQYFASAHL